jgi:hypothetical protein
LTVADSIQREKQATDLATEGFQIDVAIDVWGWDPYATMLIRVDNGYVNGLPALGDPPLTAFPNAPTPAGNYLNITPLPNWIKVPPLLQDQNDTSRDSIIEAMYPPFA